MNGHFSRWLQAGACVAATWFTVLGNGSAPPSITITQPAAGTTFESPADIVVEAVTLDADGYANEAEFFANGEPIGNSRILFIREPDPGQPITHSFTWSKVSAGSYTLTARTHDNTGVSAESLPVTLRVKSNAPVSTPVIESIQAGKDAVWVEGMVPSGLRKITLESRDRIGSGAWIPRAVERLDGQGGRISFKLPKGAKYELLRLRADADEALPAAFYEGKSQFSGQASSYPTYSVYAARGGAVEDAAIASTAPSSSTSRQVVESDIWRIEGDTLYFFNTYQGLQVIDLSQSDAPALVGTVPLPAVGEQMYVVEGGYAILLTHNDCYYYGADSESEVLVVDTKASPPQIIARVPVAGRIQESRMVGQALYLAAETYRAVVGTKDSTWEWGTYVTSVDLTDPKVPATRGKLWYAGSGNVISATDQFLFVATRDGNWNSPSVIRCIDITNPDGTMELRSTIRPAGYVKDKFKMNLNDGVFTAITEKSVLTKDRWQTSTMVETFSLKDPASPERLGQLEIGHGESLYATRFDGNRVYVVTFLRIDPLWVVDLSDPANPTISGELEIPGWSTYIQPMGNRLVSVGIDNTNGWRVAVSLFDVSDVKKPQLLSKVPLGENYSWSEANQDEKAFSVFPDAGLILLPYQGWTTNGYASRLQLVQWAGDTLTARGFIEHRLNPRRATTYEKRILSISGRELVVVDPTDLDHPAVRSTLELSWPAQRVWAQGDYVVELADTDNTLESRPVLRVVAAADLNTLKTRVELPDSLPVVGTEVKAGRLYVLQGKAQEVVWTWFDKEQTSKPTATNEGKLRLTIFDLTQLPVLPALGMAEVSPIDLGWSSDLKALWVQPDLLVWSGRMSSYRYWWGPFVDVMPTARIGMIAPWYGGSSGRLYAFSVADPAKPQFLSEARPGGDESVWGFSEGYTANGLVYASYQTNEFVEGIILPGQVVAPVVIKADDGTSVTNYPVTGAWVSRYFLSVMDYADPARPTPRKPVSIPGQLLGLSHAGAVVYTQGPHWSEKGASDGSEWVDACAYDGVQAALVGSLALPSNWPRAVAMADGKVFLTRSDSTGTNGVLEAWALGDAGKFTQQGSLRLAAAGQSLKLLEDGLALVQSNGGLEVVDAFAPSQLKSVGQASQSGCLWYDLTRATGSRQSGVWLPLQDYGVLRVPLKQP